MLEVDSSGLVEEVKAAEGNVSMCPSCCREEYITLWPSWQSTEVEGSAKDGYLGYGSWNKARVEAFTKCGAITTERVLYLREDELFYAWGNVLAKASGPEFCAKACAPPPPGKPHPMRSLFAAGVAKMTEVHYDAENQIIKDSAALLSGLVESNDTTVSTGTCQSGCFGGSKYVMWFGGEGTFCSGASKASLNVCKTSWASGSYKGTCKDIALTPAKDSYSKGSDLRFSGGSGNCKGKDAVARVVCTGPNTWTAYLHGDRTVKITVGNKCLMEDFAHKMEMSIDETLDHEEHGEHAQNLLIDCYRHALKDGVSLVERSREVASHLKFQLEDRHEERAISLYNALSEEDKLHHHLPVGTSIEMA